MKFFADIADQKISMEVNQHGEQFSIIMNQNKSQAELIPLGNTNSYLLSWNNRSWEMDIEKDGSDYIIFHRGNSYRCRVEDERSAQLKKFLNKKIQSNLQNEIKSPMPGLVTTVEVTVGQRVKTGEGLLIIEAMKMENEIKAPFDAAVIEILVQQKQAVEFGQTLVVLKT